MSRGELYCTVTKTYDLRTTSIEFMGYVQEFGDD